MLLNNRDHGYTLVELVVTLGITSMMIVLSMQVISDQQKLSRSLEEKVSIGIEAQRLSLKIGKIFESAGGQGLSPWQSLFTENNCSARWIFPACDGSDRITLMTSKFKPDGNLFLNYTVSSYNPTTGAILLDSTKISDCNTLSLLVNESVAMHLATGEVITRKATGFDAATCTLTSVIDKQSAPLTTAAANPMLNSTLNIVKVMTFFYSRTDKKIYVFVDVNNDDSLDPSEITSEFSGVHDFQMALGYDFAPRDGGVSEAAYTINEWLYDSPGESWGSGTFDLTAVKNSDLKMIRLSLIRASYSSTTIPGHWKVLDGSPVSGDNLAFKVVTRDIVFRNLTNY